MSKSLGNQTFPQDVIKQSGADILRLWVASVDYSDDQRIGPEILKSVSDNYRKLRNTMRWMLGTLAHYDPARAVGYAKMEPLDRLMLHKLAELDGVVRQAYADFDYARVVSALSQFMNSDLSAFYFDIRKDALYCEPPSSAKRLGALEAIEHIFRALTIWLAPVLCFTADEAWASRYPERALGPPRAVPRDSPRNGATRRWPRNGKRFGAFARRSPARLEISRAAKEIGSSLEAHPVVYLEDGKYAEALAGVDFAEVCIVSDLTIATTAAPENAFRVSDAPGVAVVVQRAGGVKCLRSWRYFDPATADPEYPGVTPRDAAALRELKALA